MVRIKDIAFSQKRMTKVVEIFHPDETIQDLVWIFFN